MIIHDWMAPGGVDPLWLMIDRKNQRCVRVVHACTDAGTVISFENENFKEVVTLPYNIRGLDIEAAARLVSRYWTTWSDRHPSEWVDEATVETDGKAFIFTSPCKG